MIIELYSPSRFWLLFDFEYCKSVALCNPALAVSRRANIMISDESSDDEPPPELVGGEPQEAPSESESEGEPEVVAYEPEVVTYEQCIEQLRKQKLLARHDGPGVALARGETMLEEDVGLPTLGDE